MRPLYNAISRSGVCAVSGAIAGAIVGGLFGLIDAFVGTPVFSVRLIVEMAIGLSLFAWLVVLVLVGVFGNYGAIAIAGRALFTCLATGVVTFALIYALHAGLFGMLIGWIVGFLIGKALCAICSAAQQGAT